MEEYYNTKEFRKLLRRYQKARRTGVSDYFMASELGDIIQYYAVQGKNDKAMEVSDFTLNLYPGAVEPLAFKARYALSVEDDPDQAQAYADLVEDKTTRILLPRGGDPDPQGGDRHDGELSPRPLRRTQQEG